MYTLHTSPCPRWLEKGQFGWAQKRPLPPLGLTKTRLVHPARLDNEHSLFSHVRKHIQLRSSSSGLLLVPKANRSVGAPTLWIRLPSSVKSVAYIAKFRRHLNGGIYHGVSNNLMTTGCVYGL